MTSRHRYNSLLILCCLVALAGYTAIFMRLPVIPLFAQSLGIETGNIGIMISSFYLIAGLLSTPVGSMCDRFGNVAVARMGLIILAASMAAVGLGNNFWWLTSAHLFMGMGMAAFGPALMTMVSVISSPTTLGQYYGLYTLAVYIGMSIGPGLGGFLANQISYRSVFFISAVMLIVTMSGTWIFLKSPKPMVKLDVKQSNLSTSWIKLVKNRSYLGCLVATLAGCIGLGMFTTYLPLHARNTGLNVEQIGAVFLFQGLVNAGSRIPLGWLSDQVKHRNHMILFGLLGLAMAMFGFGYGTGFWLFLTSAFVMGISMALAFTSIGARIVETVPSSMRGLAMGGYNTCIYFALMATTAVMGQINQWLCFKTGFIMTAMIILAVIGCFYRLSNIKLAQ